MIRQAEAVRKLREEEQKLADAMRGTDYDAVVTASSRVERAHRANDSALRSLMNAQALASQGASTLASTIAEAGGALAKSPAGIGLLVAGLGALTSVASAASGALGLLPAVAGSAGAAFGTLKLATLGFGEAMDSINDPKKFAEALAALAPNAQQAVLAIQSMMPAFNQLKDATQNALFAGVAEQLNTFVNTMLPTVQSATTGIASSFNQMFVGLTNQLMTPETMQSVKAMVDDIVTAFQNLQPAVGPLVDAFAKIGETGASFLPQIAAAATEAAQAFATLVAEAQESGQLSQWIQDGVTVMGDLISVVGTATELFLSLGPTGVTVMADIKTAVELVSGTVQLLTGDFSALGDMMPSVGAAITSTFNKLTGAVSAFLEPLRWAIDGMNALGANIAQIPDIPKFNPDGSVGGPTTAFRGGGGSFGDPRTAGVPGLPPGGYAVPRPGGHLGATALGPSSGAPSWGPAKSPYAWDPTKGGGPGGGGAASGPVTPRTGDPMTLLTGMPVTRGLYSAASSVLDARHKVEEARGRLNQLESSNVATADELQKARNDLLEAQQKSYEAELRLNESKLSATDKFTSQLDSATGALGEIGAKLDSDFGISKGLPGIVENLTKFIGNLAAAPYLGQLKAISDASGIQQGIQQQAMSGQTYGLPSLSGGQPRQYQQGMVPNNVQLLSVLEQMYPGLTMNADTGRQDKYGEHGSGQALDIMVNTNKALGDQVNQFLLQNAKALGLQYNIWQQKMWYPDGRVEGMPDRGDPTQNHMDHVHARVSPGPAAGGTPIGSPIPAIAGLGAPSFGGPGVGPNIPIPLPVIIVGGLGPPGGPVIGPSAPGFGTPPVGAPIGTPASGVGLGPPPGPTGWGTPGLPGGVTGGAGQSPILGAQGPSGLGTAGRPVGKAPGAGGWQPQGGGGIGPSGGGAIGAAVDAGSMALDAMAPGAGQAAQTAMKLVNRTIQYGGQLASIGVSGLLETFGLSDSALGDPSKSWLGRAAAGVAGMAPAAPTSAGQTQAPVQSQTSSSTYNGPVTNGGLTIQGDFVQAPHRNMEQIARDLQFKAHEARGRP